MLSSLLMYHRFHPHRFLAVILSSVFPKSCQKGKIADNAWTHFTEAAILTASNCHDSSWLRKFDRKHTLDVIQRKIPRLHTDLAICIHAGVLFRHLNIRSRLKKNSKVKSWPILGSKCLARNRKWRKALRSKCLALIELIFEKQNFD